MGMNGIIFEYTNEYWFHADLIYKWLFVKLLPMVSYNRSTSCLKYFYHIVKIGKYLRLYNNLDW
jgi:hypothetical protein